MSNFDYGHLTYLVLLGAAVTFWFIVENRHSLGKIARQALAWGLIFLGVIAAIGLWDDIRRTTTLSQSVFAEQGRIEIPRHPDGHYYLTAQVNGATLRFVVDTGASSVVLSRSDAAAAGLEPDKLAFTTRANTANGVVRTAPVRLDRFEVGGIVDTRLRAFVNGGEMGDSLLGMTYLQRFSKIEITGGALILTR